MNKLRFRDYVKIASYSYMSASFIVLFITFMLAFFDPSKKVLIDINNIGEANIEFIVMILGLTALSAHLIIHFIEYKNKTYFETT